MTTDKPIDIEATQAVAIRDNGAMAPSQGVFSGGPVEVIKQATEAANALKQVIVNQGLVSKISGKEYPRCEAWTLLGTIVGVFPVCEWTRRLDNGWEARVEARTKAGEVVGAAEAECLRTEKNWANRDDFALRSMAQTRATAKALRMPLGFVMSLAGFEATPAEEMAFDGAANKPASKPASTKTSPKPEGVSGQGGNDQNASEGKPSVKSATESTRNWMIDKLNATKEDVDAESRVFVTEFFVKADCLLPTESIEQLPLQFVPTTQDELHKLAEAIHAFGNGEPAQMPYRHPVAYPFGQREDPKLSDPSKDEAEKAIDPSWKTVTGKIEQVSHKNGTSAKGPWDLYGIKIDGKWYNTFSRRIGMEAQALKDEDATIYYSEDDNGRFTAEEIT